MYMIFWAESYSLKMSISFHLSMDLNICSRAELHTGKIWCESFHKFWSSRIKCDMIWMIHIIRIWKWITLTSVAILSSCRYGWLHLTSCCWVQPSRHKLDDRHTHTHTHTHTDELFPSGQKHNTFFFKGIKRIKKREKRYYNEKGRNLFINLLYSSQMNV